MRASQEGGAETGTHAGSARRAAHVGDVSLVSDRAGDGRSASSARPSALMDSLGISARGVSGRARADRPAQRHCPHPAAPPSSPRPRARRCAPPSPQTAIVGAPKCSRLALAQSLRRRRALARAHAHPCLRFRASPNANANPPRVEATSANAAYMRVCSGVQHQRTKPVSNPCGTTRVPAQRQINSVAHQCSAGVASVCGASTVPGYASKSDPGAPSRN